jgi:putative isomerase
MTINKENYQLLFDAFLQHAREMFHEPAGCLKYKFVSPGGPYAETLWDWDSFWASTAMLGIAELAAEPEFREKVLDYAKGALLNLLEYQADDGSVPILLSEKDPDWFDSTRNPHNNMAKPVLGQFCLLLDKYNAFSGTETAKLLSKLDKYYACWKRRYQDTDTGLYLWANDIAVGVDDDPAIWGRPPFSSASIFLNCLLYADLKAGAALAGRHSDKQLNEQFSRESESLKEAINEYCWDPKDGLYYSVDVQCRQDLSDHRYFKSLNCNLKPFWHCLPLKLAGWSSFMPLWCGLADKDKAAAMVNRHLTDTVKFWTNYGVRSLAADEKMYSPDVSRGNPSNWLGPIWIISNYLVWKGLKNYDYHDIAEKLSENIINLLANDYKRNGLLHEYYNPENGEGVSGPGFWNWNLLACLMK